MIYIECKPDTLMAKSLASGQEVRHLHGTSGVCNMLMEQSGCRGFVDGDSSAQNHPYLKGLKKLRSVNACLKYNLVVCEDSVRGNRLILLMPRLEEWILQATQKAGVQIERFGLPNDARLLHDVLTLGDRQTMNQFRILVQRLNKCSDRVQALKNLLG